MNSEVPDKVYALLKKAINGNLEDYSITVHGSNKKGEGFTGEMCYASVKEKRSGSLIHFVIKQAFCKEDIREAYPVRRYYLNEIRFYTKVWPSFQKFQTDRCLSKPFDKIPKCYATSSEDQHEKLLLENLKYQDFQTYNKKQTFNEEHINFILKEYGKFHAISFAYKLLNPKEYYEISKDLEDAFIALSEEEFFRDYFRYLFEISFKSLDPREDVKAIEKFKTYLENGVDVFREKCVYRGDYSVILHGDCWSNNMMFRYDKSNKLCDMRLLDFQLSKVGTPVSDLSYFLYSGGSKEIFDHLDDYLRIYHNSLLDTLIQFGLDSANIYPFEALKNDWKEHCFSGFSFGPMLWRLKLVYEDSVVDMADFEDPGNLDGFMRTKYDVQTFNCRIRELILHMVENDFL